MTIIENTNLWTIRRFGNGVAYTFTFKPTMVEGHIQGDDALDWEGRYEAAMLNFGGEPRTWNTVLEGLCREYVG